MSVHMNIGLNNNHIRQHNKKLMIKLLYRHKILTKSQLATKMQLSIPAISKIVDELISELKIEHLSHRIHQRGHSSGSYCIAEENCAILCLNVSPYSIHSLLANNRLEAQTEPLLQSITPTTEQQLIKCLIDCYHQYQRQIPKTKIKLAIGLHGQVDPIAGISLTMPHSLWKKKIEVKYLLETQLNTVVLIDNDCVALALAELWLADNEGDFCIINVDYGIGSSFVINQQIYRGILFGSGQIGHTQIDLDGQLCGCGRYGCLETVASLSAIDKQIQTVIKSDQIHRTINRGKPIDVKQIIALSEQHLEVLNLINQSAKHIGLSLYNFINTLNINQIKIYGDAVLFGEPWLHQIKQQSWNNPFDQDDAIRKNLTKIEFGHLCPAQQLLGIGYLYVT